MQLKIQSAKTHLMDLYDRFKFSFKSALKQKTNLYVACSGGLDSMVLLDLCRHFAKDYSLNLKALYIDHKQRLDTEKDRQVIQKFCKNHKIDYEFKSLSLKHHASENLMRLARYEALNFMVSSPKGSVLLTAHHADDQLETLLFRVLRGAHPQSLAGIAKRTTRQKLLILRPLLEFWKEDLESYARQHKIKWHDDKTNQNIRYSRNRIRKKLIPVLKTINPNAKSHVFSFLKQLSDQNNSARPVSAQIEKLKSELQSKEGVAATNINFELLKHSLNHLLAERSQRTTKGHWGNLKRILEERHSTKRGSGPLKTLQFPGGHHLVFKGTRLFWV